MVFGLLVVLGHTFHFVGFKGGKAVATSAGVHLLLARPATHFSCLFVKPSVDHDCFLSGYCCATPFFRSSFFL